MKEDTLFMKFFGNSPIMRVIDFLIDNRLFDYSKTDISKESGVGWATLFKIWPTLEQSVIVIKTRRIGRANLYKLNMESPIVQELIRFDRTLTRIQCTKESDKIPA